MKNIEPRHEHDFYRTAEWVTHRFLEEALDTLPDGTWLDPCAGDGAIMSGFSTFGNGSLITHWDAFEIQETHGLALDQREEVTSIQICDSLTVPWQVYDQSFYSLIMSNPPFSLATEFLIKALTAPGDPMVVFLQRLPWLASGDRAELMRAFPPDVYPLPNRPRFKPDTVGEDGKKKHGTDVHDYAWFSWPQGNKERKAGICKVLQATPLAERKRWEP